MTTGTITAGSAARAAFRALDALQDLPPQEQAAGLAFAYLALLKRLRMDNRDALLVAERHIHAALGSGSEGHAAGDHVRALRDYMKEEINP